MKNLIYNNIGFSSLAMHLILKRSRVLPISKLALVMPLITHRELLNYLSKKNTHIHSLEQVIIDKTSFFTNFNKRYYDSLVVTINSLQFLSEIEMIDIENGVATSSSYVAYTVAMGQRLQKVEKAAPNIEKILSEDVAKIYLNLRVQL